MPDLVRAEFHCHTLYSKDSLMRVEDLLAACRKKGIDRLAITDHNSIQGALHAQKLDPGRVIVGEEIMTLKGELLAFFVVEQVPKNLPPLEAIRRLREQGAFISVSHPYDRLRKGAWALPDLLEIAPLVDAVETFNARCLRKRTNELAQAFAAEHNLPGTAGSDAHSLLEVGRATLLLPDFHNPAELKDALLKAHPQAQLSASWVHLTSTYAKLRRRIWKRDLPKL